MELGLLDFQTRVNARPNTDLVHEEAVESLARTLVMLDADELRAHADLAASMHRGLADGLQVNTRAVADSLAVVLGAVARVAASHQINLTDIARAAIQHQSERWPT